MTLFKNKYRIASARLQTWDYASEGLYFITICTKDRNHYFGEVVNGEMQLSPARILADVFWHEIKNHAKDIELGEFVVMPNHIHGILILHAVSAVEARHALPLSPIAQPPILPQPIAPPPPKKTIGKTRFQNPGKNSISSIIGGYKSAVTKHCNRLGFENGCQSLFHDHIIRDAQSFENIQNYISTNVKNWKEDKFWLAG